MDEEPNERLERPGDSARRHGERSSPPAAQPWRWASFESHVGSIRHLIACSQRWETCPW